MKSADDAMQMTIFGVQVCIIMVSAKTTVQLEETKAKAWLKDMQEVLRSGKCPVGLASKLAGQLAFAACRGTDRCGRAYLKPWFAQAAAPL